MAKSYREDTAGQGAAKCGVEALRAKCGVEALRAKRGAREAEHYAPLLPAREWKAKKRMGRQTQTILLKLCLSASRTCNAGP